MLAQVPTSAFPYWSAPFYDCEDCDGGGGRGVDHDGGDDDGDDDSGGDDDMDFLANN